MIGMRKYDNLLGGLSKGDPISIFRERVEKRIQARVKEIFNSPAVQSRIVQEVRGKIESRVIRLISQKEFGEVEEYIKDFADRCIEGREDEGKTTAMISFLIAIFPNRADRDKLIRKYDISQNLCLRCRGELYGV